MPILAAGRFGCSQQPGQPSGFAVASDTALLAIAVVYSIERFWGGISKISSTPAQALPRSVAVLRLYRLRLGGGEAAGDRREQSLNLSLLLDVLSQD